MKRMKALGVVEWHLTRRQAIYYLLSIGMPTAFYPVSYTHLDVYKRQAFIYGFSLIPKGLDHLFFDNLWALGCLLYTSKIFTNNTKQKLKAVRRQTLWLKQ